MVFCSNFNLVISVTQFLFLSCNISCFAVFLPLISFLNSLTLCVLFHSSFFLIIIFPIIVPFFHSPFFLPLFLSRPLYHSFINSFSQHSISLFPFSSTFVPHFYSGSILFHSLALLYQFLLLLTTVSHDTVHSDDNWVIFIVKQSCISWVTTARVCFNSACTMMTWI